jgi:6-phosphogluconolactonase
MLKTFNSLDTFISIITDEIILHAKKCIKEQSYFNLLISGGTSPIPIYKELNKRKIDFSNWHFWLCDERISHIDNIDLNYIQIQNILFINVPICQINFHFFDFNSNIKNCISNYELFLSKIKYFDFSLLGVGEDGHIASLFPGKYLGLEDNSPKILFINDSPKYPKKRLTLSAKLISNSSHIFYIANGANKKYVLSKYNIDKTLPFNIIKGKKSTSFYYCSE